MNAVKGEYNNNKNKNKSQPGNLNNNRKKQIFKRKSIK